MIFRLFTIDIIIPPTTIGFKYIERQKKHHYLTLNYGDPTYAPATIASSTFAPLKATIAPRQMLLDKCSGEIYSGDNCSGDKCSSDNCSSDNCSNDKCSVWSNKHSDDNCSPNSNNSGDNCSGDKCSITRIAPITSDCRTTIPLATTAPATTTPQNNNSSGDNCSGGNCSGHKFHT